MGQELASQKRLDTGIHTVILIVVADERGKPVASPAGVDKQVVGESGARM